MSSCHDATNNHDKNINLDTFSDLRDEKYSLDIVDIREHISKIASEDGVALPMDGFVNKYYKEQQPFLWINRYGIYDRADTLLSLLKGIDYYGLSKDAFRVSKIEKDLYLARSLDIESSNDNLNRILARLEYNLTKAFLRYSAGQYFGFVNPDYLYNSLEEYQVDSLTTRFRQLCDLKVLRPDKKFYFRAISHILNDSVAEFWHTTLPKGRLVGKLLKELDNPNLTKSERLRILCNIERCRWRLRGMPNTDLHNKYIVVNIPSFELYAFDGEKSQTMKVCCGEINFKTPILTSWIKRMDVNPQWIVPKSISKGFLHNYSYMHKMGMFVLDREKGKLAPEQVSYDRIMSNDQYIVQAGGKKNSLGRIIFRFDNNFSVFLHDTSAPWAFKRTQRAVSHGCVRVERPLELALFLLGERAEEMEDRLLYSMSVDFINDVDSLKKRNIDRKRLVNTLNVNPPIPLYITYYTVYDGICGQLCYYDDVYGYDDVLIEKLSPFIE